LLVIAAEHNLSPRTSTNVSQLSIQIADRDIVVTPNTNRVVVRNYTALGTYPLTNADPSFDTALFDSAATAQPSVAPSPMPTVRATDGPTALSPVSVPALTFPSLLFPSNHDRLFLTP